MVITGERVFLRDYNEADFSFYNELEQNIHTYKYESNNPGAPHIKEHFLSILSDVNGNSRTRYSFLLCQKFDSIPVGRVSIKLNWSEIREWEIGWALYPDYWKRGYATEAVKILIDFAFKNLNAHRIVAYCNAENGLSEKVMIRSGMVREGILRETKLCNQKWCNELIYSILESEWR
ncbi:GNAT family N-acetyltransferase [Paenibacillus sp. GCM10027629]|uniref:GNAT family N-acetyltransferase n=1 Tax=Paenibacillus sp. GCM10027629 TaxID=3273414 RepID=UPI003644196C